jgi:Ca2+-binding RTX toxin-like protein
VWTDGTD